jgi:hypothetical protein
VKIRRGREAWATGERAGRRGRALPARSLVVGPAGDACEREAERMAARIAGASERPGRAGLAPGGSIQRRAVDGARAGFVPGPAFERGLAATRGRGVPLDATSRAEMESRFGADFGDVRIHAGPAASALNEQISAGAFTHGRDIYVGRGRYTPGTTDGRRLLAHELTHVVQQSGAAPGVVQRDLLQVPRPRHAAEAAAFLQEYHSTLAALMNDAEGHDLASVRAAIRGLRRYAEVDPRFGDLLELTLSTFARLFAREPRALEDALSRTVSAEDGTTATVDEREQLRLHAKKVKYGERLMAHNAKVYRLEDRARGSKFWRNWGTKARLPYARWQRTRDTAKAATYTRDYHRAVQASGAALNVTLKFALREAKLAVREHPEVVDMFERLAAEYGLDLTSIEEFIANIVKEHLGARIIEYHEAKTGTAW